MSKRKRAISSADLSPGVRQELEAQGLAPEPTEETEQRILIDWADRTTHNRYGLIGDYLLAIPNGGGRSKAEGGALKAQGVRSGVPDLFLALPVGEYAGLWIELKRRRSGRVSDNQRSWMVRLARAGYAVTVAQGWEEARDEMLKYLQTEVSV